MTQSTPAGMVELIERLRSRDQDWQRQTDGWAMAPRVGQSLLHDFNGIDSSAGLKTGTQSRAIPDALSSTPANGLADGGKTDRGALAFYNEIDPFAAAWLRELIKADLIAPGIVDERDIRDIRPDELSGYAQHHFFAGIGVWSLALRLAGWPDDRPIWTASCPCPPFSSAGPNFRCPECDTRSPVPNAVRTGAFDCIRCGHEWQADERHLFPELFRLIRECDPELVLGEQVASADGRTWLDVVSASLEMLGYAVGSPDTCAAGFGAPHIRQRLYWVADAQDIGGRREPGILGAPKGSGIPEVSGQRDRRTEFGYGGVSGGPVHTKQSRLERHARHGDYGGQSGRLDTHASGSASAAGGISGMADTGRWVLQHQLQSGGGASAERSLEGAAWQRQRRRTDDRDGFPVGRLADADSGQRGGLTDGEGCQHDGQAAGRIESDSLAQCGGSNGGPGPTNGYWRAADWLCCTDGKWRAVEPGTFPLADAGAFRNRVAELRGAGNAVNLAQAQGFIEAVMDILPADQVPA